MKVKRKADRAEPRAERRQAKPVRACVRVVDGRLEAPELLTLKEVADLFNISLVTLWSWRRSGLIRDIRIGHLVRVERGRVEALLRAPTNGPRPAA